MGIASSTVQRGVEEWPVIRSMAVADAADALGVPVELIEAYVGWGMLEPDPSAAGHRVTIASVGALVARRRAAGRQPAWTVADRSQAPAHRAIAC